MNLRCTLFGHDWVKRPVAPPEDRDAYKCAHCPEWAFDPARVGENSVPDDQREGK